MRFVLAALLSWFGWLACASAQTAPIIPCTALPTTVNGTTPFAVLGNCTFTSGANGVVLAITNFDTTCGAAGETLQLFIAPGATPVLGSSVVGRAASGLLTVESLASGAGSSPCVIQSGQFLTGGDGVFFTPTQITGLGTGTGGVGTYTIADNSLSIPTGTNLFTLSTPVGGMTALSISLSQNQCSLGQAITMIPGALTLTPNTQYWVSLTLSSGANNQSATLRTPDWVIVTY